MNQLNTKKCNPSTRPSLLERNRSRRFSYGAAKAVYDSLSARQLSSTRLLWQETYITCLMYDLSKALVGVGVESVEQEQVEQWTFFVHSCLSIESRGYHNIDRVFEVTAGADPFQLIAGIFQDVVRFSVDGGLSPKLTELLDGVLEEDFVLTSTLKEDNIADQQVALAAALFGLTPGQPLKDFEGLDAFLSSIVLSRILQETLTLVDYAKIYVCLESIIPFRTVDEHGKTDLDLLFDRLVSANEVFGLGLTEQGIVTSIQRAADWSNRSLGNFATSAGEFLDHTWSLLPEKNKGLRRHFLMTVNDLQDAIHNMVNFLMGLDQSLVFKSFRGVPAAEEMECFYRHSETNLCVARKYMHAELVRISVVAAFAILTGGNGPLCLFSGDLPCAKRTSRQLAETLLTEDIMKNPAASCDNQVLQLLIQGHPCMANSNARRQEQLTVFMYALLGEEGIQALVPHVTCPMTTLSSKNLLSHLPYQLVEAIGNDMATIAISRANEIQDILRELPSLAN